MPCSPKDGHSESVRVVLRCRPLNSKEIDSGYARTLSVDSKRGQVILKNPRNENESPREFTFDAVYDWNSNQADLYDETFRALVDAVLSGFNGTIFAYGQTGTGKTYTMEGVSDDAEKRGMIPRSFDHVFRHIDRSENCQYLVRASYLEIYQEEIRDLLNKDPQQRLELRERPDTGTYVKDLSSFVCKGVKEIEHVMAVGNSRRSVAATNMNEHSSRSHAICLVTVECSELGADGEPHIRVGKLSMVDLAGSERQTKTAASGERLKEATKINLSLSALGNIISALVDGKSSHIPYRDSKLTRLFQDSLGGNAKTVMVANIGPASYNYDETLSTLRYASRAKNIKNKPKINEDPKDALLREFQNEISKLKAQLRGRTGGGDKWRRRRCRDDSDAPDGDQLPPDLIPEDRLDQERVRLEQERRNIEEDHSLIAEDRERLLQELKLKDQQLERERQTHARLVDKIQSMESKLLSGGRNIADTTNQQQRQLELSRQRIADQKAREREMLQRIEAQEGSRLDMQQTYLSLQQEVEVKTKKLKKLFNRLQAVKRDILDTSDDFMEERRELEETQNTLLKELKLKCLILENFVPCEERAKLLQRTSFDDDADCWRLAPRGADCRLTRRPVSAAGARRPVSQYARLSGVLRVGTRYKGENVMSLELDVAGRTTRDYRGPLVAPRYQAALEAALSPKQSEISINAAPAATTASAAAALRPRAKPSKLARLRPAKAAVSGADYPQSRGLVPK